MTYEQAREIKEQLTIENDRLSQILHDFVKLGEDSVLKGLPTKEIRETKEYKDAVKNFDKSFAELKAFNKWFLKNFKKEYLKERDRKRQKR